MSALRDLGREMGGILLGTIEADAEGEAVRIEQAETIDFNSRRATSYVLSAEESVRFAAIVHARCAENHGLVVGFFRSQTRAGLQLYEEDAALVEACFEARMRLVVVLKPLESGLCTAGLFTRNQEGRWADFCDQEIPFFDPNAADVAIQLPARLFDPNAPDAPADVAPAADLSTPAAAALKPLETPTARRMAWPGVFLKAAGATTVAALVIFLLAFWMPYLVQRWRPLVGPAAAPSTPRQQLNLQVSGPPDRLVVTWNRETPALRNARRGVLEIQDGPQHKEVVLDSSELTGGSLVYLPATGDVLFRVKLYLDDTHTVTESVRFLSGRTGAGTPLPLPGTAPPKTAHPVVPAKPAASIANPHSVANPRPWVAPRVKDRPPTRTAIPDPPRLQTVVGTRSPR